jgi:hypothetical protein
MLAVLKAELGSLNKIKRVIKLVGFVNSTPDFEMQPKGELSLFYGLLECVCARAFAHLLLAFICVAMPGRYHDQ